MRAQHHGKGPDRFRMIAAERVAQCSLSIPARRVFGEDPEAGERLQEPGQGGAVLRVASASSWILLGPPATRSARPNLAATWIACTAIGPGHRICIICINGETGCACASPLLICASWDVVLETRLFI